MRWPVLCLIVIDSFLLQGDRIAFAQQPPVRVQDGSVWIGGNVDHSTINQGLDEKKTGEELGRQVKPLKEGMDAIGKSAPPQVKQYFIIYRSLRRYYGRDSRIYT